MAKYLKKSLNIWLVLNTEDVLLESDKMNRTVQNLYVTKMQTPIIEFGDPRQSPNSNSDPELLSLRERSRVEERDKCGKSLIPFHSY